MDLHFPRFTLLRHIETLKVTHFKLKVCWSTCTTSTITFPRSLNVVHSQQTLRVAGSEKMYQRIFFKVFKYAPAQYQNRIYLYEIEFLGGLLLYKLPSCSISDITNMFFIGHRAEASLLKISEHNSEKQLCYRYVQYGIYIPKGDYT